MSNLVERLRDTADAFELAHAPHHLVLYMRAAADEIERLRAGGCARDQGTTQYCAEAAILADKVGKLEAEAHILTEENERLRAALEMFVCDCTVQERCAVPDVCHNFQARRALARADLGDAND